jgi:hypothetical protein
LKKAIVGFNLRHSPMLHALIKTQAHKSPSACKALSSSTLLPNIRMHSSQQ